MSYNPPPQPPQGEPPNQPYNQPPQQYQPQAYPPPNQPPQYQPQQYQPQGQPPNMPPPPPGYNYGGKPPVPAQVNTVAILMFIGGGFAILGGLLLFALSGVGAVFAIIGVILLIVGGAEIWVGVALRQLKEWARTAAIVLAAISGLFNLISAFKGSVGSIIGLIIDVVIIYLLMQKPVVDAFARTRR